MSTANGHSTLPGGPRLPRSSLDRTQSPTTPTEIDAMRRRAWHHQGVATLSVDEIWDPFLRQAVVNEAVRRWGRRHGGDAHGG
jgi:hypothetical protein